MSDLLYFIRFLYATIRYKIFVWIFFVIAAAILDGLSVGLFLPILEGADSDTPLTRGLNRIFEFMGLDYLLPIVLGFMVLFYLIRTGFLMYQEIYAARIVTRLLIDLKCDLVEGLFKADYRYFIRNELAYFTNAVTTEYTRVASAFEKCLNFCVSLGFALVYFTLPMIINPVVTGAILLLSIPAYFIFSKVNRITRDYSFWATANNASLQSYLIQAFHNFKYLKATHSDSGILQKIYDTSQEQGEIMYKQTVLSVFVGKSIELVLLLLVAGLLLYYVEILGMSLIEILFLLFILRRAISYTLRVQQDFRKFVGASGSIKVFKDLQRELQANQEELPLDAMPPDFDQPIRFKDVSYSYTDSRFVLKGLDLTIHPKSTVAFVGASGAGKSTLVTLLTGILKPTAGEILQGDTAYRAIDQSQLRRGIGYVTQESVIFNDTIGNNITLWKDDAKVDMVRSVATRAYLAEFIESLPQKYDTVLGDSGLNISGGQRQRVNIARELFKDAQILIFDEATSSLDTTSEREIQKNIDDFRGEKTVIVIAHRLSTVKNSDMIFVLKGGEIIERGSYAQLYNLGGEFTSMVNQQSLSNVTTQAKVQ